MLTSYLNIVCTVVGASGALFGYLGFDLIYLIWNWSQIPGNKYEACMLTFVLVINLLIGLGQSGIDLYAHLGGLICGIVMAMWLAPIIVPKFNNPRIEDGIRIFGAFLTLAIFLIMLLLLFSSNPCSKYGPVFAQYCDAPFTTANAAVAYTGCFVK